MALEFEPLRLLEPSTEWTHKSDQPGNGYDIYIALSDWAPEEWTIYFEEKWRSEVGSDYKRARIEVDFVVLENCPLTDAGNFKDKLISAVEHANQMYVRSLEQRERRQREQELERKAEQEQIQRLKDHLRFD
jgi:hypothetical protein